MMIEKYLNNRFTTHNNLGFERHGVLVPPNIGINFSPG